MATPTWEQYMIPSLQVLADGETRRTRAIGEAAADRLGLADEDRAALIPSGQLRYQNRANWALSYLYRAGAVERPARGQYRINDVGRRLLAEYPGGLVERDLRALPDYVTPHVKPNTVSAPGSGVGVDDAETALDPVEQIETGIARIHADVAAELLSRLHAQDPAFFEQAVLDLLMTMGYGGAEGTATRTQLSNDGGIDGIIDQDALGLARIYVQAKRYALDSSIGRPEIQAFVGALHGNQANQGVFITTARFTSGACQYADSVATRVVLIDGERLSRLMIRYGVGVQVKSTYKQVEIDEDFFE